MSADIFGCHDWESDTVIQLVETRDDATKYHTMLRTARITKAYYPAQNVNNAEGEKPWSTATIILKASCRQHFPGLLIVAVPEPSRYLVNWMGE